MACSTASFCEIKVRPLTQSGQAKFRSWIELQDWREVLEEESVDIKAEKLHNMVLNKLNEVCPEKNRRISSDDEPWYTGYLKKLQRKKSRLFRKNRHSEEYKRSKEKYEKKIIDAKKKFKQKQLMM